MKNQKISQIVNSCCLKFILLKKVLLRKQLILPIIILSISSLMMTAFSPSKQGPQQPADWPSPRDYVAFAYDSGSNQIILFGGMVSLNPLQVNNETWAYDVVEETWTLMKPSTKPPRLAAATMAYDSESDRVILYGGCGGGRGIFNDTWAYDYEANTWTKMSPGPKWHGGGRMVYDEGSDRMVLFGGIKFSTWSFYEDTWAYDYNSDSWVEMHPAIHPQVRNYQAMTYDSKEDLVLVSGTYGVDGMPDSTYNMWAYDLEVDSWEDKTSGDEERLSLMYSTMAYDAESERSILFGGVATDMVTEIGYDETWAYDYTDNTWEKMEPETNPGFLSRHFMVYVPSTDKMYLFGGLLCPESEPCQLSNELWTYDYDEDIWKNIGPVN
ncbi:MAG TPA: kelch repeat-containing protein [Brevefilum sp.]